MADSKKLSKQTEASESTYSRDEILNGYRAFGVDRHLIAGALRLTDKERFTRDEAEKLIKKFAEREA